ncbi:MAG TPA: Type 1 glutamine amidotransferase-like domain-containing protein [Candidatus Limnocylindria bacterium]|nr:Type 1 glutamine amidotransferase-like domain-containing protein [Candidatus Limnocylindria bacterium]
MSRGRLLLLGSGEFTPVMDDLDREILASIPKPRPRIAIVPTASGLEETPQSWSDMGIAHFAPLGADAIPVMVLRRDDARDRRWIEALRDVDWIFFSGGRPQHAIAALEGTPFWDAVVRRHREGAVLAGASAGAMMLGEKSYAPDNFDEGGFPQTIAMRDGLNVLPGHFVIPHFDLLGTFPSERVGEWIALWPDGCRGIGIDEDTAIVEGPDRWTVWGRGRAVTMSSFQKQEIHPPGTSFDAIRVRV